MPRRDERAAPDRARPSSDDRPPGAGEPLPGFGNEAERTELGNPPIEQAPREEERRRRIEEHNAEVERRRESSAPG